MDRKTKTILAVAAGIVVMCACTGVSVFILGRWGVNQFVEQIQENATRDPDEIEVIATSIADFDLPRRYQPDFGFKMMGTSVVNYTAGEQYNRIILMQFLRSAQLNPDQMRQQLRRSLAGRSSSSIDEDMTVIEQRDVIVRSQPAIMTVSEGVNSEGQTQRQVQVYFQGKEGLAVLSVTSLIGDWDQAEVDAFIASFR
jgi:hypothetical protein